MITLREGSWKRLNIFNFSLCILTVSLDLTSLVSPSRRIRKNWTLQSSAYRAAVDSIEEYNRRVQSRVPLWSWILMVLMDPDSNEVCALSSHPSLPAAASPLPTNSVSD